ncbi:hypothetical protein HZS_5070 [Henneguya salminicola]|nr:hypothetical protein HZS_5070 [Henneguya salminicola]
MRIFATEMEFIINNKINCKCNNGYKGKYCQIAICRKDCNGNGYCVSKEACACYSIYKGKLCNEYPCSENIVNPCVNGGICYQTNNSIKCNCPFRYTNGKYCQTLSCGKKCKNGKCIFIINDEAFRCLCKSGWYGPACGILRVDHTRRHQFIVMIAFNLLLALIDIFCTLVIAYIYLKLNKANNIGGLNILKIPLNHKSVKNTPNDYSLQLF